MAAAVVAKGRLGIVRFRHCTWMVRSRVVVLRKDALMIDQSSSSSMHFRINTMVLVEYVVDETKDLSIHATIALAYYTATASSQDQPSYFLLLLIIVIMFLTLEINVATSTTTLR